MQKGDEGSDLMAIEDILAEWGIIRKGEKKPILTILGGGVSNLVVKVETTQGTWVVKSSLPKLRVNEDWFADRNRIMREVSCLKIIADRTGQEYAPRVLREDRKNFACMLECAPDGTVTWKQDLMKGKTDPGVTEKVGGFLSQFHARTRGDLEIRSAFEEISNFIQLRINPYLTTIAQRHEDLKAGLEEIVSGLITVQLCLVHGDFSPKNILLLPDGREWMIDCEVAHYGNPAFDVAFCANHLILKAFHLKSIRHMEEAERFWNTYWKDSGWSGQENFTVKVLSALMLARIDGKSPVEYLLEEDRILLRGFSRNMIANGVDNFREFTDLARKEILKK